MDSGIDELLREASVPDSSQALDQTLLSVPDSLARQTTRPAKSPQRRGLGVLVGLAAVVGVAVLTPAGQAAVDLLDGADAEQPVVASTALFDVASGRVSGGEAYQILVNRPAQMAASEPDGLCFTLQFPSAGKALTSCGEVPGQGVADANPPSQDALAAPTSIDAAKAGIDVGQSAGLVYGLVGPEVDQVAVFVDGEEVRANLYRASSEVQTAIGASRALGFFVASVPASADYRVSASDDSGQTLGSVSVADRISPQQ